MSRGYPSALIISVKSAKQARAGIPSHIPNTDITKSSASHRLLLVHHQIPPAQSFVNKNPESTFKQLLSTKHTTEAKRTTACGGHHKAEAAPSPSPAFLKPRQGTACQALEGRLPPPRSRPACSPGPRRAQRPSPPAAAASSTAVKLHGKT